MTQNMLKLIKQTLIRLCVFLAVPVSGVQAGVNMDQEGLNLRLRLAAQSGGVAEVKELLKKGADINSRARFGETALLNAVTSGRFPSAIALAGAGANPNLTDDWGASPLLRAASDCNGSRVVDALVKGGADVNHQDSSGQTALMKAVHADCERTVAVLLLRAKDTINLDAEDDALQTADDLAQNGLVPHMLQLAHEYRRGYLKSLTGLPGLQRLK